MNMKDELFKKRIFSEFINSCYTNHSFVQIPRMIKTTVMSGTGLKELSVLIKTNLSMKSEEIFKYCNMYNDYFKLNLKTIGEKLDKLYKDAIEYYIKNNIEIYIQKINDIPVINVCKEISDIINKINDTVEFIKTAYKLNDSTDDRFNIATAKSLHEMDYKINQDIFSWNVIEKIESDMADKKIDIFSDEYGKLICAKLRSFKADIMNSFNKTFGTNSVFAELELNELVF